MPRVGIRSALLVTAVAVGLSLTLALGMWTSSGASPPTAGGVIHTSSNGTGVEQPRPGSGVLPSGATSSPAVGERLRSMAPTALDTLVASEEAAARQGSSPSKTAEGTWLIGAVGTYLVGRGATPGTYESAAPAGGRTCRWVVAGKNGGTLRSGSSKTRSLVTIHKTDGFFQTNDCSNWHKTS